MEKSNDKACDLNLQSGLIESLTELRDALASGEKLEERFTMRTVDLRLEPQAYTGEKVKQVRAKLSASQAVFAKLLGVKPKTVQSWEQGLIPPPMARRLLDIIDEEPDRWREILRKATKETVCHK